MPASATSSHRPSPRNRFRLRAGSATYDASNGPERWGDYTAINRDPLDGQFLATSNQYAGSSAQWQQFISTVTDN